MAQWEKDNKEEKAGLEAKPARKSTKPGETRRFKYEEMNHNGKLKDYVIEREA